VGPAGHPLGPLGSDLCTLPPRVRYIPGVTLILVNSKFSCNFLKCSNLAHMHLKSNKYQNHGTRLVDKVNTWLFYTFTRHIGA
jgi:hypothetical protein